MIKNVVMADDDREMLEAVREGLEKYQETFSLITAENGLEALDHLKKNTVSLVVTDLKMPEMDGFSLLAHIMEHYPYIPVITVTGYSTPEMEKLAKEGGSIGYIKKPFMIENLARVILSTLRKESEGGTLHSVSSGIFLQLMEMEQKTCTIRLFDKASNKQGILFFEDGELLNARINNSQGKEAAYEIFAWDEVNLSIQNVCLEKRNVIQSDLQALSMEAMRLKDEKKASLKGEFDDDPDKEEMNEEKSAEGILRENVISDLKKKLDDTIGTESGVENISFDKSWDDKISAFQKLDIFFSTGAMKLAYIDDGGKNDLVILSGNKNITIELSPKCPRDRITEVLADQLIK